MIVGLAPAILELGGGLVLSSGGVTVAAAFGVGAATGVAMSLSPLPALLPEGSVERLRPERSLVLVPLDPAPAPAVAEIAPSSPPTVIPSARSGVAKETVAATVVEGESSVLELVAEAVVGGRSRVTFLERVLARLSIIYVCLVMCGNGMLWRVGRGGGVFWSEVVFIAVARVAPHNQPRGTVTWKKKRENLTSGRRFSES